MADEGKLFDAYLPFEIIYNWYFWDNEECLNFIEKTVHDDENLLRLLGSLIRSFEEEDGKIRISFYIDAMNDIYPIEKIYVRVKLIISNLTDDEKLICECFIEEYEKKNVVGE